MQGSKGIKSEMGWAWRPKMPGGLGKAAILENQPKAEARCLQFIDILDDTLGGSQGSAWPGPESATQTDSLQNASATS